MTGNGVFAAVIPGKMRRAAGAGDDDLAGRVAAADSSVLEHLVGHAVRRDDAHFARDAELLERVARRSHRLPIGTAAHNDADDRSTPACAIAEAFAYHLRTLRSPLEGAAP